MLVQRRAAAAPGKRTENITFDEGETLTVPQPTELEFETGTTIAANPHLSRRERHRVIDENIKDSRDAIWKVIDSYRIAHLAACQAFGLQMSHNTRGKAQAHILSAVLKAALKEGFKDLLKAIGLKYGAGVVVNGVVAAFDEIERAKAVGHEVDMVEFCNGYSLDADQKLQAALEELNSNEAIGSFGQLMNANKDALAITSRMAHDAHDLRAPNDREILRDMTQAWVELNNRGLQKGTFGWSQTGFLQINYRVSRDQSSADLADVVLYSPYADRVLALWETAFMHGPIASEDLQVTRKIKLAREDNHLIYDSYTLKPGEREPKKGPNDITSRGFWQLIGSMPALPIKDIKPDEAQ